MKTWKICVYQAKTLFGLYPTFKEWKLIMLLAAEIIICCLYPTFKEWKRISLNNRYFSS